MPFDMNDRELIKPVFQVSSTGMAVSLLVVAVAFFIKVVLC